jgi:hypothetical protein
VALCQARISTKPLWGFSSSNPYHSQSRAEQQFIGLPKLNDRCRSNSKNEPLLQYNWPVFQYS